MKFSRVFAAMLCLALVILIFPVTARADMGPKPSVQITFRNMGDELCYGTLLSKSKSTGPYSAWDGDINTAQSDDDIWLAFTEYKDSDGFYYLETHWEVSKTDSLSWTYYPPSTFKILLYYPETDTFVVSDIYERYAFDSYFTVDMSTGSIEAVRSYQYQDEIVSLLVRILATIVIEMAIALLFGFRSKKELLLLTAVNVLTQIILNVSLNIINYNAGSLAFSFFYIVLEIAVFIIESVIYCIAFKRLRPNAKQGWFYVLYALLANAASYITGLLIATWLPGIF